MSLISVKINGQEADFESTEDLPVAINKRTDDLGKLVAGEGSVIQNAITTFNLPATLRNLAIVQQAYNPTSNLQPSLQKFTLNVSTGGSNDFSGFCLLKQVIHNGNFPKMLIFETLGDGLNVWDELDGVSLRDIDMGQIIFSTQNVLDSQTGTPDTGWSGIFAPVCFGNTSGPNDPSASYNGALFQTKDLRYHVYFYHIAKSIFNYLGYSLDSEFFEGEFFKSWVYLFGVGNKWELDADISTSRFRATLLGNYTLPSPGGGGWRKVRFNDLDDPQAGWDGVNYYWVIPTTGVWEIKAGLRWSNLQEWRLIVEDPISPLPDLYGTFGTFTNAPSTSSPDTRWFRMPFRAGCRISIEVRPKNPSYTIFSLDSYLQAQLIDNFILVGSPLKVEKLLHDNPAKDFLAGITHMFGLTWFVNNRIKKVYCEPRFDYFLPDPISGIYQKYNGWYSVSGVPQKEMLIDQDTIEMPIVQVYGKFLRLSYKEDSDPLYEYYQQQRTTLNIKLNGIQANFDDRGEDGTDEENPYFSQLFLGYSNTVATQEFALPFVLPDDTDMESVFEVDNTQQIIGTLPDPTYLSEPKCGIVYQGKTFIRHQDTISPWGSGAITEYALIMQSNCLALNRSVQIPNTWNGSYSKTMRFRRNGEQSPSGLQGQTVDGLVRYFYYTYLSCVAKSLQLIGKFALKNPDIAGENFRALRRITINGVQSLWILQAIRDFRPAKDDLTTCEFFPYAPATQEFVDTIEQNDMELAPFNHINKNALP